MQNPFIQPLSQRLSLAALSCACATVLLAACGGGGGGDSSTDAAAAAAGTSSFESQLTAPATSTANSTPVAPTWTQCATENGTCNVSGTRTVRYGLGNQWATRTATDSIACSNDVFGDPAPGVNKICEYDAGNTTAASNPSSTDNTTSPSNPSSSDNANTSGRVFGANSFWYQEIPSNAPLHPNSAGFVADFQRQMRAYYGNVTINTDAYASPVYYADASTPTTKVSFWDCQGKGSVDRALEAQWEAVPIPANAQQSDGTDGEMTVYQPSTDTIWEFWQTRKVNGQWQACWGGKMTNVSKGDGLWAYPYGTSATGLPFLGGQITAAELQAGEINHAIGIALVEPKAYPALSWPANRTDGFYTGANAIAEGQRFFLDKSVNVDALNIHPVAKTIARAAQKYGFVVWDKAGALSLRAENPKSYTSLGKADPYPALFNGTQQYAILDGFPWDKLRFLPMDYGKP